jgi:hypothetical protein
MVMRSPDGRPGIPPFTVWIFAGVVAAVLIWLLVDNGTGVWLLGALLLSLATVGVVSGLWSAWAFLSVVTAGDIVVVLIARPPFVWSTVAINGIMFALLLAPPTRQWIRYGRPRMLQ